MQEPNDKISKLIAAVQEIASSDEAITTNTHLRDDLNMDSGALIELTVLIHTKFGVDVGRVSAERKKVPETIGDLLDLLS